MFYSKVAFQSFFFVQKGNRKGKKNDFKDPNNS